VKEVILPDMIDEFDGTESLCVAFERKNRSAEFTSEKNVLLNQKDEITAEFNESFNTDVTLHKDKNGPFRVSRMFSYCN